MQDFDSERLTLGSFFSGYQLRRAGLGATRAADTRKAPQLDAFLQEPPGCVVYPANRRLREENFLNEMEDMVSSKEEIVLSVLFVLLGGLAVYVSCG